MAIKDLQVGQGKVDVVVEVTEKGAERTFNKYGRSGRVATAKVKDETGQMALTLWNEDIDKVGVGDKIHLVNGYVSEWQGEAQLSTGRFGSLEIVEKGTGEPQPQDSTPAPEEKSQPAEKSPNGEENTDDSIDVEEENIDDLYDEEE
jgi:ssDNA-binding replication factor A large subunit